MLRFSDYIVAMAYKVMSMWFLKCRLPFRKIFNEYIIRVSFHQKLDSKYLGLTMDLILKQNLQVNVIQPLEESINQEEHKKRSGSFNSENPTKM